jgi:DNA-binding NtrC family response regulator
VLSISAEAEMILESYAWPGNVRELGHVMERSQILCQKSSIQVGDLGLSTSSLIEQGKIDIAAGIDGDLRSIEEIEAEIVGKRLTYFDGDATKASKSLGLSRSAFYRRLEKSKD